MSPSLLVSGYHGTNKAAAERILSDGYVQSRNPYDWLGDGVYFFQDAPARARAWVEENHPEDAPAVLKSSIRLTDCMDLLDIGWAQELAEAYDAFLGHLRQLRTPIPLQKGGAHRLDRHVLNYIVGVLGTHGITIRCIRAAFIEGKPVYPDSALFSRAHVQIAVRDTALIENTTIYV